MKSSKALIIVLPILISFATIGQENKPGPKTSVHADVRLSNLDTLKRAFTNPPAKDRPEVLWQWMGGMLSKEGMKKDLEALAAQGVGGVTVMQLSDQTPNPLRWNFSDYPGKVKCLSDEWFNLVNYAVGEADRLGMTFSMFMSPGWSHIGIPGITPELGVKKLVNTNTKTTGNRTFDAVLAKPAKLDNGESGRIPEWLLSSDTYPRGKDFGSYYSDVSVLAMPAEDSLVTRLTSIIDITSYMDANGRLTWKVPPGTWTIIRLGLASENGVNHPAPYEGSGLEADRMNSAAIRIVYDKMIARVVSEARAKGYRSFKAFETDSYEGGVQDFGKDFPEQFKLRRGYDCIQWLPAWLFKKSVIENEELTQRFRYDMMKTISELTIERTHGELRRLADENKLEWMTEPYWRLSIDWRTAGARATMPGSEFWVSKPVERLVGAAPGIAALYGHPVVWAEAFTAESYSSAWRNDPFILKPFGDEAFCRGINHFVMHGFVHNPFNDRYQPGLTMSYWGTQLSRHATWWPYAAQWHQYLARCQFMLKQGKAVNDVLAYPGTQEPVPVPAINAGPYRQVVLNDEALFTRLSVVNGRILSRGGGDFAALALTPGIKVTPRALRKLRDLVILGATLIGKRPPAQSPSMEGFPACDKEIELLINEIWGSSAISDSADHKLGLGRVIITDNFVNSLNTMAGGPDVQFSGNADSLLRKLDFVHRRDGDKEIYFVCNKGNQVVAATVDFRVAGYAAEQWDAITGEQRNFSTLKKTAGRTGLDMRFEAGQSFFIVFRKIAGQTASGVVNLLAPRPLAIVDGPWSVSFDKNWGGPGLVKFEKLEDWSLSDKAIKYYSGTATYQKNFDCSNAPVNGINTKNTLYLDLGVVRNIARVTLNGRDLGVVWCAPWRLKIPAGFLKRRDNKLTIHVANTWVNRLIGDEQLPPDGDFFDWDPPTNRKGSYDIKIGSQGLKDLPAWFINNEQRPSKGRFTFSIWRFYNKDAPLPSSGLLGPVSIGLLENP